MKSQSRVRGVLSALVLIAVQSVMPDSAWAQTYTVLDGGTFSGNVPANPADGSTIDLQGATATGNVTVTLPTGAGGLTINSATGESVVAIDSTVLGTNGTALFTNTTTGSVIVNLTGGLVTFTGGSANLDGAVITSSSGVTINGSDVTFSDNKAGRSGGALIVRKLATAPSGNLVINADNVTLTNNTARAEGGALFTSNGAIVIGNGAGAILVQNNSSNGAVNDVSGTFHTGGAISAGTTSTNTTPSTLTINGASITILGNSLTGRQQVVGGAIYARRGVTLISSGAVELSGNSVSGSSGVVTSSVYGGAIGVGFGSELIPVTITGDTITLTHNTATATATTGAVQAVGGAIYATGEITLTAAGKIDAEGNKAITPGLAGGGALYSGRGAVTLTGSEIVLSDNYVSGSSALSEGGGAIYSNLATTLTANAITLTNNTASGGWGGAIATGGDANVAGAATITNNMAGQQGGAIWAGWNVDLNAISGDITFSGNRHGVTFTGGVPDAGSGTANAIYLNNYGGNKAATLNAAGNTITFFDPIENNAANGLIGVIVTGGGTVIFDGSHYSAQADLWSKVYGKTEVHSGTTFLVQHGAIYGVQASDVGQTAPTSFAVQSGGTLGGNGTIGSDVTIDSGGILAPSAGGGTTASTLTIDGDLVLNPNAILDYHFGAANVPGGAFNDLTVVHGQVTLDGTIHVTTTPGGTFGPGVYRVISYDTTGTPFANLVDHTLAIGTIPLAGFVVQTSVDGQVNLVFEGDTRAYLTFWDGDAGPHGNSVVNGGNGTWQAGAGNTNWTDVTGTPIAAWADGQFAIFMATPGTVQVDNALGAVTASGMQFASDGYVVQGDVLTLIGPQSEIHVGDGTSLGAGMTATITTTLTGETQLVKTDLGTLVLTAANHYTGGTALNGGTVQVAADANLGALPGALSFDGGTLHTTASFTTARAVTVNADGGTVYTDAGTQLTLTGALTGVGTFTKAGAGEALLTAPTSAVGAVTITSGQLTLAQDGLFSAIGGGVAVGNGTTLAMTAPATLGVKTTFSVGDTGTLAVDLPGTIGGPKITAQDATLGANSALVVTGFNPALVGKASLLSPAMYTVIHTIDGITGDFGSVNVLADVPDYLRFLAGKDASSRDYNLGLGLSWYAPLPNSHGTFTLDGNAVFDVDVPLVNVAANPSLGWDGRTLTKVGTGTLTLSALDSYTGFTNILGGTVALSGAGDLAASAGVTLAAPGTTFNIAAASGNRTIQDLSGVAGSQVVLGANTLTEGTANTTQFDGVMSGTGGFTKQGAGFFVMNGINTYTGPTSVNLGGVVVGDAAHVEAALAGGGPVTIESTTLLGGYGRIAGNVENLGIVAVGAAMPLVGGDAVANFRIDGYLSNDAHVVIGAPGIVGNTLTVGRYIGGTGSTISMNTILGSDNSLTDRLVILGGSATGTSTIGFTTSGNGALTKGDGILIVDARNGATTSADSFKAAGNLSTPLYDYTFSRGGLTVPSDNWYLRSTYRAELSDDAAISPLAQLYGVALVGTLHERVGDEMRLQGRTDLKDSRAVNGVWGRVLGLRGSWDGGGLQANGPAFDYHLYAVQGGVDLYRREHDNGSRDHLGVVGSAGSVSSTVTSDAGNPAGGVTLDIKSVGGNWTHFGERGWYLDGLAQYSWINARVTSPRMASTTTGTSLAASLEGGYPVALNGRTQVEPQAQVIYQRAAVNPLTDALTTVTFGNSTWVTGRVGARFARTWGGMTHTQPAARSTTWARVSVWKELSGSSAMQIDATSLRATYGNSWLDMGGGGDTRLSGLFTLYGSISYQTAVSGSRHAVTGSGGLRLNW